MSRRFKYALQADNSSITNITTSNFRTTDIISSNVSTGSINANTLVITASTTSYIAVDNSVDSGWSFGQDADNSFRIKGGIAGGIDFSTTMERLTFTSTGNMGIGTTAPGYTLHVEGNIYSTQDITAFSDIRKKTDIITIDKALDKVEQLRGVYFTNLMNNRKGTGVIAQEIEEILPEVVLTGEDGYKSVAYGNVVGILIEAIKELSKKEINQQTTIDNLNHNVFYLQNEKIINLENQVSILQNQINTILEK